jgi:hypothetical protein
VLGHWSCSIARIASASLRHRRAEAKPSNARVLAEAAFGSIHSGTDDAGSTVIPPPRLFLPSIDVLRIAVPYSMPMPERQGQP